MQIHCISNKKNIPDNFQEQINLMQQSLSSKANWSSANQQIPPIL
jgi:hypothetical protein